MQPGYTHEVQKNTSTQTEQEEELKEQSIRLGSKNIDKITKYFDLNDLLASFAIRRSWHRNIKTREYIASETLLYSLNHFDNRMKQKITK